LYTLQSDIHHHRAASIGVSPKKKLMTFMAIVLRAQKEVKPIGILHKKNHQNTSSNRVITAF
jgi:hypothetical protein